MIRFHTFQGIVSLGAPGLALIACPAFAQQSPVETLPVATAPPVATSLEVATVLPVATTFPAVAAQAQAQVQATAPAQSRDVEPNRQDQIDGLESDDNDRKGLFDGSTLTIKPRTYYLNRDRDTAQDNVGWALGGSIEFKSGWWNDVIQVAGTVYTSQILYGPEERDGTLLFKPGPEQFTVLGEANVTARFGEGNALRIGRQSFDLPWLSKHDIRMAPNTFEAIAVGRKTPETGFGYVAGYVSQIKRKNDDEFIPMSQAAGAAGSDSGLVLTGAQYNFGKDALIGATNQTTIDVMNTFFVKAEKAFALGPDTSFRLYGQYTDQRSIGADLIGRFETYLASVKGELFYKSFSFRLAASVAGDEKGLQSPFGGPPNYLSIIVDNFDRAGEEAFMIGASYDFADAGIKGLSMFGNIATGNTPDGGPTGTPDETEYDLTIDYKFGKDSIADGLWIRTRGAWIDQDESEGGDDFFDFRIIVNYSFNVFGA